MCRLPFGAKAAPAEWCVGFEIYLDLINDLLASPDWDPADFPTPDTPHIPPTKRQPPPPGGYP